MPKVQESVRRRLWQTGNGMCYMCKKELDSGNSKLQPSAKVAHIIARGPTGPRANPDVPIATRNAIENLMLMCPDCHDKIDNNPGHYTVDLLRELKTQHEVWAVGIRQSGQPWRQRYLTVDFVNLPRILALPGGEAIWDAAQSLNIDDSTPLRMAGYRSGLFVGRITPILRNLDTRAIPLNKDVAPFIQSGAFVSFNARMRAKNILASRRLSTAHSSPKVGMLIYESNGIDISIRFDLRWLTTETTFNDLLAARSNGIIYAGVGVVANATPKSFQISAMVFGKPMTPDVAAVYAIMEERGDGKKIPRTISLDDLFND
ncbi:MAG TPA: HNH endonuclease signature motif containing protein [Pseudonocardiaceae bacterium]|nr:HNH endonuclease signature motif containing protein [Pseudonocardiaceae bacterium]